MNTPRFFLFAFLTSALAMSAFISTAAEPTDRCCALTPLDAIAPADAAVTTLPDKSLYLLDSSWKNQHDQTVKLADYSGRPVIILMGYLGCQTACPLLLNKAETLLAELPEKDRSQVKPIFVSFDPAHDTPTSATAYIAERGLECSGWDILMGTPDSVRELAAILGIRYQAQADGNIFHSNIISVLDDSGVIRAQLLNLSDEPRPVVEALKGLTR
ncbi:MAG: SCO family protein [Verrucomicrobiota bacterium]|nr:SCO family protein [Verrucomicrobiota bacterium]